MPQVHCTSAVRQPYVNRTTDLRQPCVLSYIPINTAAKRTTVVRLTYAFVRQTCEIVTNFPANIVQTADRRTTVVLLPCDVYELSTATRDCEIVRQKNRTADVKQALKIRI